MPTAKIVGVWFKKYIFLDNYIPAKQSFSGGGVYCFQHIRHSSLSSFCQHLSVLFYNFDSFCPILFKFTSKNARFIGK